MPGLAAAAAGMILVAAGGLAALLAAAALALAAWRGRSRRLPAAVLAAAAAPLAVGAALLVLVDRVPNDALDLAALPAGALAGVLGLGVATRVASRPGKGARD
jgi:hypothetical protein